MAKFKAGDMITDGTCVLMVNRVYVQDKKYSFGNGKECYSLDDGNGGIDLHDIAEIVDREFKLCD